MTRILCTFALLAAGSPAFAANFDEALDGDLADWRTAGDFSQLPDLDVGSNFVDGFTNALMGDPADGGKFTIPAGFQLDDIIWTNIDPELPPNPMVLAFWEGSDPNNDPVGIMPLSFGFSNSSVFGPNLIDLDAAGLSLPLAPGEYSLGVLDLLGANPKVAWGFDIQMSVPEPASWFGWLVGTMALVNFVGRTKSRM